MTGAKNPAPTVYLVNQFSRLGHLDLYARLYCASALRLGYRVVLIAEHESGIRAWLNENHTAVTARFQFRSREELSSGSGNAARGFWGRVARAWRRQGPAGILKGIGPSVTSRAAGLARRLPGGSRMIGSATGPGKGMSFEPLVDEILAAERASGWPASLVFFLYLDMMREDRQAIRPLDERLKRPWAGILFHPRHDGATGGAGPERYFEARTARGAAFLNPHRVEPYGKALPGRVFGLVPDVTDATTAPERPAMATEFAGRANGRTIVALVGSLGPDKGLAEFLRVIDHADREQFFFVLVGHIFWASLGDIEPSMRRFVADPPENCFVHVGYVDDERDLNSLLAASDILYAVYPNQRDSANTLTKAALLEKPVVVSSAHLMGERVRTFNLGAAVAYGDVDEVLRALSILRHRARNSFGFAAYRQAHSIQALEESLARLLDQWIGPP